MKLLFLAWLHVIRPIYRYPTLHSKLHSMSKIVTKVLHYFRSILYHENSHVNYLCMQYENKHTKHGEHNLVMSVP